MSTNTRRTLVISKLAASLLRHQLSGNRQHFSQTLFNAMFELGGIYIKFLQVLLLRSDLFADQTMTQQIRVYENVTPEPIDIEATLSKELGASWRNELTVCHKPFAAGSFGQVYKATLNGGRNVVIKVLRPSLTTSLSFDLRLLGIITWILGLVRPDGMMDHMAVYRDFRDVPASEINYRREAAFALEMHERFKNHHSIVIPYTYIGLSTSTIITQDYIDGISIAEVMQKSSCPYEYVRIQLGSDLDYQLQEMGFEFLRSMFAYPTGQGDPHPGNIKLLPNNKVGIIDFGIIADAPADRAGLFRLCKEYAKIYNGAIDVGGYSLALLGLFAGKLIGSIETFGETSRSSYQTKSILREMAASAEAVFATSRGAALEHLLGRGKFMTAFSQIINENNRFGLRVSFESATFLRSSYMFVSLVNNLDRRETVLKNVYNRIVSEIPTQHPDSILNSAKKVNSEQSIEIIVDWLDRVAKNDPILFSRLQTHIRGGMYV